MSDVTIKLTLGSFSVEVTGPLEFANEKFNALVDQYLAAKTARTTEPSPVATSIEPGGKQLSAGEFLKSAKFKNQFDQAMLLGYYLEKFQSQTSFTTGELGTLAREVKRPFGNVSDIVAKLTARGLMMSSGDKEGVRAYAVTASGEQYVESLRSAQS